jgi:hypothetical protein
MEVANMGRTMDGISAFRAAGNDATRDIDSSVRGGAGRFLVATLGKG